MLIAPNAGKITGFLEFPMQPSAGILRGSVFAERV